MFKTTRRTFVGTSIQGAVAMAAGAMVMTFDNSGFTPYMFKTLPSIRDGDMFPFWPQNSSRIEIYIVCRIKCDASGRRYPRHPDEALDSWDTAHQDAACSTPRGPTRILVCRRSP